jgi:hypothetical protein
MRAAFNDSSVLQAQSPVPSQRPLDAAVVTLEPADVLPDALLENRLPRHQLEAESILDHCEASADEAGDAGEAATDIFAGIK